MSSLDYAPEVLSAQNRLTNAVQRGLTNVLSNGGTTSEMDSDPSLVIVFLLEATLVEASSSKIRGCIERWIEGGAPAPDDVDNFASKRELVELLNQLSHGLFVPVKITHGFSMKSLAGIAVGSTALGAAAAIAVDPVIGAATALVSFSCACAAGAAAAHRRKARIDALVWLLNAIGAEKVDHRLLAGPVEHLRRLEETLAEKWAALGLSRYSVQQLVDNKVGPDVKNPFMDEPLASLTPQSRKELATAARACYLLNELPPIDDSTDTSV